MESVAEFLSWLGQRSYKTDPDCILGIIIIAAFVYAIVDIICVIIERRQKKRLTQPRRKVRAGLIIYSLIQKYSAGRKRKPKTRRDLRQDCIARTTIIHRHEWERYRQPDIGRSVGPAPPVKQQVQRYVKERIRALLR